MVERQHGVRLAAAEVGQQLHHGIASVRVQPIQGVGKQVTQTFCDIGTLKEIAGIAILVGSFASCDLPEIGGEFRLLKTTGGDVGMWSDDITPGTQSPCRVALDGSNSCLAYFFPGLILKADAQELLPLTLDLCGLVSSCDGCEQTLNAVESTVGIVGTERLLMGPFITHFAQLTYAR